MSDTAATRETPNEKHAEMQHRGGHAAAKPADTAVVVAEPEDDKRHAGGDGKGEMTSGAATGFRLMEPVNFTSDQLTIAGGIFAAATIITWYFVGFVHDNRSLFPAGDLYSGQVCAFLLGICVLLAGVYHYALILRTYVNGEEPTWTAACRRHLDDAQRVALNSGMEFVLLLFVFFLCDRTSVLPRSKKHYNRDQFWFMWIMLMIAALFTLRRAKPPAAPSPKVAKVEDTPSNAQPEDARPLVPSPPPDADDFHVKWLQRDQTEEWKGWMQVMFLWYHYFEAKEIYNAIRLYIAAYVWMTGFGNFSYYYVRKDFSFERFCQMQWRLNFLVLWVCLLLANEYMLYYINMLHTYFTLLIYVGLGVWSHMNQSTMGVTVKIAALFAFSFVMWDIPGVFDAAWAPFTWLVQYNDPYNTKRPVLHEWSFRSGLDHYIWIFGMITAFNHPNVDALMVRVDSMGRRGMAIKFGVLGLLCAGAYAYATTIFALPKKEYNALHPYTAVIPITLYILVRNLFPTLRRWHMHLFEYLGKITLETYIAQFHVWMATTGVNGAPKRLLVFIPGDWPLVNFVAASAVFFVVSLRLFHNTNSLKAFVLPPKSSPELLRRNLIVAGAMLAAAFVWSAAVRNLASRSFD